MCRVEAEIGHNIKSLRMKLMFTQAKLSEQANISLKHLGEIERGRGNPTLMTLEALAQALQVPLTVLLATESPKDIAKAQ